MINILSLASIASLLVVGDAKEECNFAVEILQVQDASYSYDNMIGEMENVVLKMLDDMRVRYGRFKYGVSSFVDKPIPMHGYGAPYGNYGTSYGNDDYCYLNLLPLTEDSMSVKYALAQLKRHYMGGGGDLPENPLEAQMFAALDSKVGWSKPNVTHDSDGRPIIRVMLVFTDDVYNLAGAGQKAVDKWNAPLRMGKDGELTGGFGAADFNRNGLRVFLPTYNDKVEYDILLDFYRQTYLGEKLSATETDLFHKLVAKFGPNPFPKLLQHPGDATKDCWLTDYPTVDQYIAVLKQQKIYPIFLISPYQKNMWSSARRKMCREHGFPTESHNCIVEVYRRLMEDNGLPGLSVLIQEENLGEKILEIIEKMVELKCIYTTITKPSFEAELVPAELPIATTITATESAYNAEDESGEPETNYESSFVAELVTAELPIATTITATESAYNAEDESGEPENKYEYSTESELVPAELPASSTTATESTYNAEAKLVSTKVSVSSTTATESLHNAEDEIVIFESGEPENNYESSTVAELVPADLPVATTITSTESAHTAEDESGEPENKYEYSTESELVPSELPASSTTATESLHNAEDEIVIFESGEPENNYESSAEDELVTVEFPVATTITATESAYKFEDENVIFEIGEPETNYESSFVAELVPSELPASSTTATESLHNAEAKLVSTKVSVSSTTATESAYNAEDESGEPETNYESSFVAELVTAEVPIATTITATESAYNAEDESGEAENKYEYSTESELVPAELPASSTTATESTYNAEAKLVSTKVSVSSTTATESAYNAEDEIVIFESVEPENNYESSTEAELVSIELPVSSTTATESAHTAEDESGEPENKYEYSTESELVPSELPASSTTATESLHNAEAKLVSTKVSVSSTTATEADVVGTENGESEDSDDFSEEEEFILGENITHESEGSNIGLIAGASTGAIAGVAAVAGAAYAKFGAGLLRPSPTPDIAGMEQVEVHENHVERETMEEVTMDMFQ